MSVSKGEAARALQQIEQAKQRMGLIKNYGAAAPFFILWGLVWLGANLITDIDIESGDEAWLVGLAIGIPATIVLAFRQSRCTAATVEREGADAKALGFRFGMTGLTLFCFFAAILAVVAPLDARQGNAFISLIWAFIYMMAGVWLGWRLFTIGAVTAAAILLGYFMLEAHFYLWMGVVGGGALIAGGLWLRKV